MTTTHNWSCKIKTIKLSIEINNVLNKSLIIKKNNYIYIIDSKLLHNSFCIYNIYIYILIMVYSYFTIQI